jgi:hypothetical protein
MSRSDEQMSNRDEKCREIEEAFKRAQVGTRHQRMDEMPYSAVTAWLNYGFRGQRRVTVTVDDQGDCRVSLSRLYDVPENKTGDDMLVDEPIPLLFSLPASTPDLGNEIVRRVREATFDE